MFLNFFLESKVIILNYMQIKTHTLACQSTSTCIQLFNVELETRFYMIKISHKETFFCELHTRKFDFIRYLIIINLVRIQLDEE
jgi:hypothetical protein